MDDDQRRMSIENEKVQKLEDTMQKISLKIKHHENNLKFMKVQKNKLDDSILDIRVALGKIRSASGTGPENKESSNGQNEDKTIEQILRYDKSTAGFFCQLQTRNETQITHILFIKDVIGVVALLGKVDNDNLIRPYAGQFIAGDHQRRLAIRKPRYLSEETPPGFLGFVVNMINIDIAKLYCVTSTGHGLRETLFYRLFSRLQVYKTRADMLQALPIISDGAISLDGGIIKGGGIFSLGEREVAIKFPKSLGRSNLPENYFNVENRIKELK